MTYNNKVGQRQVPPQRKGESNVMWALKAQTTTLGEKTLTVPNPIVNVDVGETIADEVVEEGEVEDTALGPVLGGVAEDEM